MGRTRVGTSPRRALLGALAAGAMALCAAPGCGPLERLTGGAGDGGAAPPEPAPAEPPAPPPRRSLLPGHALLPPAEYARLAPPVAGVPAPVRDEDFTTPEVAVSVADRLDAIAARLGAEGQLGAARDPIPRPEDRDRAERMPFRGNPGDVLFVERPEPAAGPLLFVPLGGDRMTPGDEVAVVDLDDPLARPRRVPVGLRPLRLALHPAGLVVVCNAYSRQISVLDPRRGGERLLRDGEPVEIHGEFHCSDLAFDPPTAAPAGSDVAHLWVANRWRRALRVYRLEVRRDARGEIVDLVQTDASGAVAYEPLDEIPGVGPAPTRLTVDPASRSLFVANALGGAVVRVDLDTRRVVARFEAGAPAIDVAVVGGRAFVPTLMPDRGLLAPADAAVSPRVQAPPLLVTGLDGALHEAHPGALLDGTRSYNFEDVRNGLFELDPGDLGARAYISDDVSAEPNIPARHRLLAGALPQAALGDAAGGRLYLAFGGSDRVQELRLDPEAPAGLRPGRVFETAERPFALALDEAGGRLFVAAWGGEVVEGFDREAGTRLFRVDLGYARPPYPATALEEGERRFYDASWSNNRRKSCAHCHFDELVSDGVGFSNGVTAPTALHRVKPNHGLLQGDAYFWNGSFDHGSYRSLAFASQLRTNCELVLFGLVEGPASDPATRVGDPANVTSDGRDADCRPLLAGEDALPANFDAGTPAIVEVVAAQQALAEAHVRATTGLAADELARRIDLYSVAERRLPPNPLRRRQAAGELGEDEREGLLRGEELFRRAGCAGCHDPGDPRQPFANGAERGRGADWSARFAATYADDPRLRAALPGGLPSVFLRAIRTATPSPDVNVHRDPIDFFAPFCFGPGSCLAFDDPLEPGLPPGEEARRLERLLRFQLADPARGFVPGNVRGQVKVNVPSLRGVWTQANLLHHGLARSLREAILAPGHPALRPGERGRAVDAAGRLDSHGFTRDLAADEIEDLELYVRSIE